MVHRLSLLLVLFVSSVQAAEVVLTKVLNKNLTHCVKQYDVGATPDKKDQLLMHIYKGDLPKKSFVAFSVLAGHEDLLKYIIKNVKQNACGVDFEQMCQQYVQKGKNGTDLERLQWVEHFEQPYDNKVLKRKIQFRVKDDYSWEYMPAFPKTACSMKNYSEQFFTLGTPEADAAFKLVEKYHPEDNPTMEQKINKTTEFLLKKKQAGTLYIIDLKKIAPCVKLLKTTYRDRYKRTISNGICIAIDPFKCTWFDL